MYYLLLEKNCSLAYRNWKLPFLYRPYSSWIIIGYNKKIGIDIIVHAVYMYFKTVVIKSEFISCTRYYIINNKDVCGINLWPLHYRLMGLPLVLWASVMMWMQIYWINALSLVPYMDLESHIQRIKLPHPKPLLRNHQQVKYLITRTWNEWIHYANFFN